MPFVLRFKALKQIYKLLPAASSMWLSKITPREPNNKFHPGPFRPDWFIRAVLAWSSSFKHANIFIYNIGKIYMFFKPFSQSTGLFIFSFQFDRLVRKLLQKWVCSYLVICAQKDASVFFNNRIMIVYIIIQQANKNKKLISLSSTCIMYCEYLCQYRWLIN